MHILVAEKRLNGARYYAATVKVEDPHWAVVEDIWYEIEDWCYTNFGERPMNRWPEAGDRWFVNNSAFWFKDEQDLMLFMLRWQ